MTKVISVCGHSRSLEKEQQKNESQDNFLMVELEKNVFTSAHLNIHLPTCIRLI